MLKNYFYTILFVYLFFLNVEMVGAQTNRFWSHYSGRLEYVKFNPNHTAERFVPNDFDRTTRVFTSTAISKDNGKPLFTNFGAGIIPMTNNSVNDAVVNNLCPANMSQTVVRCDTNAYTALHAYSRPNTVTSMRSFSKICDENMLNMDSFYIYQDGIYKTTIELKDGRIVTEQKNELVLSGEALQIITIQRIGVFEYLAYVGGKQKDYIISIKKHDIHVVDSVDLMKEYFFMEPIPVEFAFRNHVNHRTNGAVFTRNGRKLYVIRNSGIQHKLLHSKGDIEIWSGILEYDLDRNTHNILSPANIVSFKQSTSIVTSGKTTTVTKYGTISGSPFCSLMISPNDSVLYFFKNVIKSDFLKASQTIWEVYSLRLKESKFKPNIVTTYTNLSKEGVNSETFHGLALSPYGDLITFLTRTTELGKYSLLSNWGSANKEKKYQFRNELKLPIDYKGNLGTNPIFSINPIPYNYIRVNTSINYDCDASLLLENITDESFGISKYRWELSGPNGFKETSTVKSPTFHVIQSGSYKINLIGISTNEKYTELYNDTVIIDIPSKPKTTIQVSDTLVCAYHTIEFMNITPIKYFDRKSAWKSEWDFGDGTVLSDSSDSQLKIVKHHYTKPGFYSVTMRFYNGFCDSMTLYDSLIQVIESPTPGFEIDKIQGCAPMVLTVTDTNSVNVLKKEYNYSDGSSWVEEFGNTFSHKFNDQGSYKVVQRLTGYTGCVTQMDSIIVRVSPGYSLNDSTDLSFGTFNIHEMVNNNVNQLLLTWQWDTIARSYKVYRGDNVFDLNLIAETVQHSYLDERSLIKKSKYFIVGIDSCGNESSIRKHVKPIYLEGYMENDNSRCVLNFNSYESFNSGDDVRYQIFEIKDDRLIKLNDILTPDGTNYIYNAPRNKDSSRKFVVSATCGENMTWSNSMKLNYFPTIFFPNSISPNNDGLNDRFCPIGLGIKEYSLKVYNSWGEVVFEGNNFEWKPEENTPLGIYMFASRIVNNDGGIQYKYGIVHVVR